MKQVLATVFVVLLAMSAQAQDEQRWWGYYDGEERLAEFGTGSTEDYHCAMFVPGNKGVAVGKKIVGVRVTVQGVADVRSLKLWLSRSLPQSGSGELWTKEAEVMESKATAGWGIAEEMVSQPYTLSSAGVYVGYSLQSDDPFPVLTTQSVTTQANGFFLKTSATYPSWVDMSTYRYGNVAIELLLEGSFLDYAASVKAFPETVLLCGSEAELPVTITNEGNNSVSSIDYTVTDEDGTTEGHLDLPSPIEGVKSAATVVLPFAVPSVARASQKSVTITRVNGQPNAAASKSATGTIVAIAESARRTTVMEEYTGTWCGWCPRGTVGISLLKRDFGEEFIGIAVHDNDPMTISDYASQRSRVGGYPSAFLNRLKAADPYHGSAYGGGSETTYGIYADVEREQQALTPAEVSVEATWTNDDRTAFVARASVTPLYDRTSASPYALAYVLLADSLKGEGKDWAQSNDYANVVFQGGYASEPNLGFLTEQPAYITDVAYNNVAIATAGLNNGVTGSVRAPFTNGIPIVHEQRFNIGSNVLVQDKQQLRVVAMLLNTQTGEVVTAAECRVVEQEQSGVEAVEGSQPSPDSSLSEAIYDLNGRRQWQLQRGLNIVRRADGSVVKMMK